MQTVRRYVFFSVIGLVAALVYFSPSASELSEFFSGLIAGESELTVKTVLFYLLAAVVIFALVKQAVVGIPNMFRERIQRIRRAITLALMVSLVATLFLIG